jgi:hypothetical protein
VERLPMRSKLKFALLFAVVPALRVSAQDEAKPSAEHKVLDGLVGTWDVAIQFKVGPGRMANGKATCTTKWILDDHILHQEYKSTFNGKPFTTLQLLGYDARKRNFFEIVANSMESGVQHNEGTLSADGKTLTQRGSRLNPATNKREDMRTVLTFQDKHHYTLEWFLPDEQGNEERAVILKHTRKGS